MSFSPTTSATIGRRLLVLFVFLVLSFTLSCRTFVAGPRASSIWVQATPSKLFRGLAKSTRPLQNLRRARKSCLGAGPRGRHCDTVGKNKLIKVTDETVMSTAGLIGGIGGLSLAGFSGGVALFACFCYLSRKTAKNKFSTVLRGVAHGAICAMNTSERR